MKCYHANAMDVVFTQVSKDDRSDIESSSDEDVSSSIKKTSNQTFKPKDINLNGGAHDQ